MILGCHLSEKDGFMGMGAEALGLGTNTFQFFSRNPRGGKARPWDSADIEAYQQFAAEHNLGPIVAYAPYTANPAAKDQKETDFAKLVYAEDLARLEAIPHQIYALIPGSALGQPNHQAGLYGLINTLNEVLLPHQTTTVCIVTNAGSENEICSSFEELQSLLEGVRLSDHVGVCFDVARLWGAGYDVKGDLDGVLSAFDKTIGLNRIKMVHLADPKYDRGTHHTNHEALGEGHLGLDGLSAIATHEALRDKVLIFETPHEDMAAYQKAIAAVHGQLES